MKGFTLIELAIVLVIVALLVGGVLAGQDLIKQARLRQVLDDVVTLERGITTFRAKYGFLPGDDSRKAINFAIQAGPLPWDCDGTPVGGIDSCRNNRIDGGGDEIAHLFENLKKSGMFTKVADSGSAYRTDLLYRNNRLGIPAIYYAPYTVGMSEQIFVDLSFSITDGSSCGGEMCAGLIPSEAYFFDVKRDDGLPLSGVVQAVGDHTDAVRVGIDLPVDGDIGDEVCITNETNPMSYNQSFDAVDVCQIIIRLNI